MNPVFWALVMICLVILWFLLAFAYKWVGAVLLKIFNDAKEEIMGDDAQKEQKENNDIER